MNPLARRTILRKSRIFGYSSAVLSIPFAFLGGLIASCCPFGVLVGSAPLMVTSALGALLAALFLDYSVVTKRESTSAGMKVGVRSAVLSALVGGIFTTLTASQTLVGVMSATQGSSGQEAPAGAPIMIGIMNLLMLLLVVGLCVIPGIIWGVIGAALKGSAALDVEPEPSADWDEQIKQINKGSLIEWGVILGLLVVCSLIVPAIQGMMVASRQQSSPVSSAPPYQYSTPRNTNPLPSRNRATPEQAYTPKLQPPSNSADGNYTVEKPAETDRGEREIGAGLLSENCQLRFFQSTRELVFTFEWAARYGAQRTTIPIGDLDLKTAAIGDPESGGIFKGSVPVTVPTRAGKSLKVEKWRGGSDDFSWSMPPYQTALVASPLQIMAADKSAANRLVASLLALTGENASPSPTTNSSTDEAEKIKYLLLGRWIERKLIVFFPDGTWAVQRNEEAPLDKSERRWELVGDKLKRSFPGGQVTVTILSIDAVELKLRDDSGNVTVYRREQVASGKVQGEVHPETRLRILKPSDVSGWSKEQLQFAINEMFARHGFHFQKDEVRAAFMKYSWYQPDQRLDMDEIEEKFSEVEKANVKLLGEARNGK